MNIGEKKHFENLDAIRFVLALMVVLGHSMFGDLIKSFWDNKVYEYVVLAMTNGAVAVSFFFTLSGFLITYLLLIEKEKKQTINFKNFYMRRILRIWPVYFFVLFFGILVYPYIKTLIGIATNLPNNNLLQFLFLGNFDSILVHKAGLNDLFPMMIGITWSVSIEEQFYLFWPLLFLLPRNYLLYVFIILVAFSYSFVFVNRNDGMVVYYHTFSRVMDLSLGAIIAYLALYSSSYMSFFENLSKKVIILIYTLSLIYLVFFQFSEIFIFAFLRDIPFFDKFLLGGIFIFIISEQNFSKNSFFKFSNWKFGSSQGKYTYGFYMLHPIGIQVAVVTFKLLHIEEANIMSNFLYGSLYVFISLSVSYVITVFSYKYFESYFLNLKHKF